MDQNHRDDKCGWRVSEWAPAAGLSRATVFNLLADGAISGVKSGAARIITTSPRDYLASLAGDAEPDPVGVIRRGLEAGLEFAAVDDRLRQRFPKLSRADKVAAYREAARQFAAEADALDGAP